MLCCVALCTAVLQLLPMVDSWVGGWVRWVGGLYLPAQPCMGVDGWGGCGGWVLWVGECVYMVHWGGVCIRPHWGGYGKVGVVALGGLASRCR